MLSYTQSDKVIEQNNYLPWTEKYRPKTLDEIISHGTIIETLKNAIRKNGLQHLLFHGVPGSGKTSTIMACARELYGSKVSLMTLIINASEDRGIEMIRLKVIPFVTAKNIFSDDNIFKLVILDEADAMTADAQAMLRKVIENYSSTTRFCLICNYIKKISLALQSRCACYRFPPLTTESIRTKILYISEKENISVTEDGMQTMIKISHGDMRRVINILQSTSMSNNVIDSNSIIKCTGYINTEHVHMILNALLNNTFDTAYSTVCEIKKEFSYTLSDIITELSDILINYCKNNDNKIIIKIDKNKKLTYINILKILDKMRVMEFNLTTTTTDNIQTVALIGNFNLCLNN